MSIKINNAKIQINNGNTKIIEPKYPIYQRCTINKSNSQSTFPSSYESPYFSMQKEWIEFPYSFVIQSLKINGIEYANGQYLDVFDLTDLRIAPGLDGRIYYTNIVDWINSIIPPTSGIVFYDDMNTVDYPVDTQFEIIIEDYPGIGLFIYKYDNFGFYTDQGGDWYQVGFSSLYSNCQLISKTCTINTNPDPDTYNMGAFPYFAMEKYWSGVFPYIFTMYKLKINGVDYITTSFPQLTINNLVNLQVATSIFDGRVYYTNVVDWVNSELLNNGISQNVIKFHDDMNTITGKANTTFEIIIGDENTMPYETFYRYTNNGLENGNTSSGPWQTIFPETYPYICTYL